LKKRLFGVTANEGNHGEDVKECYYYLDNTPTHSYLNYLYKYPQAVFPYRELMERNRTRGTEEPEWKLTDSGVFDEERYFDVFVEYAKRGAEDIRIRATVINRGPERAVLHVLPTAWFRNTWTQRPGTARAGLRWGSGYTIDLEEPYYGQRRLYCDGSPELLFMENETNWERLYGGAKGYAKDGIKDCVVEGRRDAVNPQQLGTTGAAHYLIVLDPGESAAVRMQLAENEALPFADFDGIILERKAEADEFYSTVIPTGLTADARDVMRQALAGMSWSKQFYHYVANDWLKGDPGMPSPPAERKRGRNHESAHLYNADLIAMPDKWEYPWYTAWDLGIPVHSAGADRSGFRQGSVDADRARMVYASERSTTCVRVGIGRHQPSRACLGGMEGLRDREEEERFWGPYFSAADLSQTASQLYVVGQPRGCGGT